MWSLLILAYSLSLRIWPPGSAGSLAVFNTLLGESVCHIIGVDTCSGPHLTTETHSSNTMAAETCSRSCRCALVEEPVPDTTERPASSCYAHI